MVKGLLATLESLLARHVLLELHRASDVQAMVEARRHVVGFAGLNSSSGVDSVPLIHAASGTDETAPPTSWLTVKWGPWSVGVAGVVSRQVFWNLDGGGDDVDNDDDCDY